MGIFIQLRCYSDVGCDCPNNDRCYSFDNIGPSTLAGDTAHSIMQARRWLNEEAARSGWKRIGGEWTCPACQREMARANDDKGDV